VNILVTGANGFVGSHLVRHLLTLGHRVHVLCLPGTSLAPLAGLDIAHHLGDVTDGESVARAVRGQDALFHVAANLSHRRRDVASARVVNVGGTENVLAAARAAGLKRVVVTSSVGAVGGDPTGREADETFAYAWPAELPYFATKRDAEAVCRRAAAEGLEVVMVNPSVVMGPEDGRQRLGPIIWLARRGLFKVALPGLANVVDVRDVAAGHWLAFAHGKSGERYILAGENLRISDLIGRIAAELGRRPPRHTLPTGALTAAARIVRGLERVVPLPEFAVNMKNLPNGGYYSSERARRELGFRTRQTAETIRDTVAWYVSQGLA
jgi:dihydroflavonol-4-reductase